MSKAIEELLEKLGLRADQLAGDFEERVNEWKLGLDAETRRAVRPYWMAISVASFVLGCVVGNYFF